MPTLYSYRSSVTLQRKGIIEPKKVINHFTQGNYLQIQKTPIYNLQFI